MQKYLSILSETFLDLESKEEIDKLVIYLNSKDIPFEKIFMYEIIPGKYHCFEKIFTEEKYQWSWRC